MYKPYGIIPPIITPFREDGSVDYDALAKMSVHLVENGVHGLFPFGTTGEFYAVNDEEFVQGLKTVKEAVAGHKDCYGNPIQLLAGTSHITTRGVIHLIKLVEEVGGYDAVSVLTPMFVSQTQEELYQYYKTIAASTELPIIMYNNKPKTNVTIAPRHGCPPGQGLPQYHRRQGLHRRHDQLRGISPPDDEYAGPLQCHHGPGHHDLRRPALWLLRRCGQLRQRRPRVVADIYDKFVAGDYAGSLEAQYRLAPLRIATGMGTFPEVIKEGLVL